jgi:hypothetical protein
MPLGVHITLGCKAQGLQALLHVSDSLSSCAVLQDMLVAQDSATCSEDEDARDFQPASSTMQAGACLSSSSRQFLHSISSKGGATGSTASGGHGGGRALMRSRSVGAARHMRQGCGDSWGGERNYELTLEQVSGCCWKVVSNESYLYV